MIPTEGAEKVGVFSGPYGVRKEVGRLYIGNREDGSLYGSSLQRNK